MVPNLDIKEETGTINMLDYLEKEGYDKCFFPSVATEMGIPRPNCRKTEAVS